jgi:MFS transporter, PPP family, 3-phenylpropionic acid transporter
MPAVLSARGLTGTQIGFLLATGPAMSLVAPPLWGQLADAWGQKGKVLGLVCLGAGIGLYALFNTATFWPTLGTLLLVGSFQSAVTSLIDSIAMAHAKATHSSWPLLRAFGSAGFVTASLVFGAVFGKNPSAGILWPMLCLFVSSALAFGLMSHVSAERSPQISLAQIQSLLRRPNVGWFLLATCLHWLACAPWHGVLALHLKAMNEPPLMVGIAFVVAVMSELIAMLVWSRVGAKFRLLRVLTFVFVLSAVRWFLMGVLPWGWVPILTAPLHGFTFGTFYICAVSFITNESPAHLKSTGQSLFVAATFGMGGLIGFMSSGVLYDAMGGHSLFLVASVVQLLPLIPLLQIARSSTKVPEERSAVQL